MTQVSFFQIDKVFMRGLDDLVRLYLKGLQRIGLEKRTRGTYGPSLEPTSSHCYRAEWAGKAFLWREGISVS